MISGHSAPRCLRIENEHGEILLSRMWYLFEEDGVISPQPMERPSSGLARDSDAWSILFNSIHSNDHMMTVWIRHSICASCTDLHPSSNFCMESAQHAKRGKKKKEVLLMRYSFHHSNINVHQNILLQYYSITVRLGQSTVSKVPSFCLSETTMLVFCPAPSPLNLCLDSSARALDTSRS